MAAPPAGAMVSTAATGVRSALMIASVLVALRLERSDLLDVDVARLIRRQLGDGTTETLNHQLRNFFV